MADSPKPLRIEGATWAAVPDRLEALSGPVAVTETLRPGDTRNGAVKAFLRAVLIATE